MKTLEQVFTKQEQEHRRLLAQLLGILADYPFAVVRDAFRQACINLEDAYVNEREERGMQEAYAKDLYKSLEALTQGTTAKRKKKRTGP